MELKMSFFKIIDEESVSESTLFQSGFSFSQHANEGAFETIKIDFVFQVRVSMVKIPFFVSGIRQVGSMAESAARGVGLGSPMSENVRMVTLSSLGYPFQAVPPGAAPTPR